MRRHILLTIAFRGSAYHGFQVQSNAKTVAQTLQDALEKLLGVREEIKGCSRTDSGVHAVAYAVSFFTDANIPCIKLPLALNAHLPADIRVCSAREVPQDFHARYSAKSKTYLYRILNSPIESPFEAGLSWRINAPLDADAMQKAAAALVGQHDFASFMSAGSTIEQQGGSTVRTVTECAVTRHGDEIRILITADGYLYNMVRIIAGTLAEVGAGRLSATALPGIVAACDRSTAGPTAPAKGLFLYRVEYDAKALGDE